MARIIDLWRDKFPRSMAYLDKDLPALKTGERSLWEIWRRHAHLTELEADSALGINDQPPTIWLSKLGPVTFGEFDPEIKGRIAIAQHVCFRFEDDPTNSSAQEFLRTKVLHEMCHWGCHLKQVPDLDVAGENFENEVFGDELAPWWADGRSGSVLRSQLPVPEADKDASARAAELNARLNPQRHMPGRAESPGSPVFAGIDVGEGMSRGYRNNNPGNVRVGLPWVGLAEDEQMTDFQRRETAFCVFLEPEWGLRAIIRLMKTYRDKHGLKTPRQIVSRWAPASDNNDVESYSRALADALGVLPDDEINVHKGDTMLTVVSAIAKHENGSKPPYADVQFRAAALLETRA